jgi:hypothetical protein
MTPQHSTALTVAVLNDEASLKAAGKPGSISSVSVFGDRFVRDSENSGI